MQSDRRRDPWGAYVLAMVDGHFFEAHEILEIPWRKSHQHRLQIAIWLAAAFVHWSKNEYPGTVKLFEKILGDADSESLPIRESIVKWTTMARQRDTAVWPDGDALSILARWGTCHTRNTHRTPSPISAKASARQPLV